MDVVGHQMALHDPAFPLPVPLMKDGPERLANRPKEDFTAPFGHNAADRYGLKRFYLIGMGVYTLALAQHGVTGVTRSDPAFVLAFQDTYGVSALLACIAVLISFSYWPRRR